MTDSLQPLISARRIKKRVAELASQIAEDHRGAPLTLVIVLKGATVFAADLMRQIGIPFVIDFVRASSYGKAPAEAQAMARQHPSHVMAGELGRRCSAAQAAGAEPGGTVTGRWAWLAIAGVVLPVAFLAAVILAR